MELTSKVDLDVGITTGAISATMRCEYPMDVTVTSDKFVIQKSKVSGTQSAVGNLADGFSLEVNPEAPILGNVFDVSVNWDLTLGDISFNFVECNVEQAELYNNVSPKIKKNMENGKQN
mgnify:CR=1 FL=1